MINHTLKKAREQIFPKRIFVIKENGSLSCLFPYLNEYFVCVANIQAHNAQAENLAITRK